jgi:hypothetical protein
MRLFLIHEADFFRDRLGPALAECVRKRSFAPLRSLTNGVRANVEAGAIRDHLTPDEAPLFLRIAHERFSRPLWRHVAGELLLHTAVETPSFPLAPELLSSFMPTELVERLHRGSRDVSFDGVPYRPDAAGLHDVNDVAELARTLSSIDAGTWSADRLAETPPDDRADELDYARQRFRDLRAMFESARDAGLVLVCEEL